MNEMIGHPYTENGIERTIRIERHAAIYPYPHTDVRWISEATLRGKRSRAYRDIRAQLGDDYVADLTASDPTLIVDALRMAGLTDDQIGRLLEAVHQERMAGYTPA